MGYHEYRFFFVSREEIRQGFSLVISLLVEIIAESPDSWQEIGIHGNSYTNLCVMAASNADGVFKSRRNHPVAMFSYIFIRDTHLMVIFQFFRNCSVAYHIVFLNNIDNVWLAPSYHLQPCQLLQKVCWSLSFTWNCFNHLRHLTTQESYKMDICVCVYNSSE